jgi:small subunit ribosomal protein S19
MVKKEFLYYGKTLDQVMAMSHEDFMKISNARARRSMKRGFTDEQKKLLKKVRAKKKNIETHCRDMVILPEMIGLTIKIHNGKSFEPVIIIPEMLGHALGEFSATRKRLVHSAPGIGASKSSSAISVK